MVHVHLSEYGSFLREGAAVLLARLLRKPAAVTLHGAKFEAHARKSPALTRVVLNAASHVFCLGPDHQRIVRSLGVRTPTSVIMNPIPQVEASEDVVLPEGPYVLFVGEVGLRKGFDRLESALKKAGSRRLLPKLVVCGPLADGVKADGARWVYLGQLDRPSVLAYMAAADAVVLPSRAEVLPMVILEALDQGTRAIYTTVGEWSHFRDSPYVTLIPTVGRTEDDIQDELIEAILDAPLNDIEKRSASDWIRSRAGSVVVATDLVEVYKMLDLSRLRGRGRVAS